MSVEILEIQQFLSKYSPFDQLETEVIKSIAQQIEIRYIRKGEVIFEYGNKIETLFMVRSGSVELTRKNGSLSSRIAKGEIFGQVGLLMGGRARFNSKAISDTLLYLIPAAIFHNLVETSDEFSDFMEIEESVRVRQSAADLREQDSLMTTQVKELIYREPVILEKQTSILETAIKMRDENVSAILIEDRDDEENDLLAIVTDRDLTTKAIAENRNLQSSIFEIATKECLTIDESAYVYEALMMMLKYNINHLPVVKKHKAVGILESSDLMRYESQNSLLIVNSILQQTSVEDLAQLSQSVQESFVRMAKDGANSQMIGSAMSIIGRSFKQRLCELGEEKLGTPPVPYCLLALGSMARDEQLLVTDQDNAFILSNNYDEKEHSKYFEDLATFICDGLNDCGYVYCTGDIMATNPKWRMTMNQWKENFADWIDNPNPEKLLNSSIFFDLDGVYGNTHWADQLYRFITNKAKNTPHFLSALAHTALLRTPPLGFFGSFVMEKDGRQTKSINLKRRGTAPLVDLIRVHALAIGSLEKNSFDRLKDIIEANYLPKTSAKDLRDALELLSTVRIAHQALSLEQNEELNNSVKPDEMADFERRHLKDAFKILSTAQQFMKFKYPRNRNVKPKK